MKKIHPRLKFILLNTITAVVLVCIIVIYSLYYLDNYTQHGKFLSVPSLHDMTPDEAKEVANHTKLRVLVIDSIYDSQAKPGTIVEQYPSEGSKVKENRLIHLTINASNPEKVIFPNFQNAAYRQTVQTLSSLGLKIGRLEYAPSEFKNLVLQLKNNGVEIQTGALLNKGALINIVLGSGKGSNQIFTPQLVGKNVKEAIDIIRNSYLNIGKLIPDKSIDKNTKNHTAVVYQQYPKTDSYIKGASNVNLYITVDQEKIAILDSLMIDEQLKKETQTLVY